MLDGVVTALVVIRTRAEYEKFLRKIAVEEGEEGNEGEDYVGYERIDDPRECRRDAGKKKKGAFSYRS